MQRGEDADRIASRALERYDLTPVRLDLAASSFNSVFRLEVDDGRRFAVRVGSSLRIHPDGTEQAEAAWLTELRRDGVDQIPLVIPARDGTLVTQVSTTADNTSRPVVVLEWINGTLLRDGMTRSAIEGAGRLAALLHQHAATHVPDVQPSIPVADEVLYWSIPSRLDELVSAHGRLFIEALDRVDAAIAALWRDPPHRPHHLHGDIGPSNVIVRPSGMVALIDFQDLTWGFELQDLAIAVSAFRGWPNAVDAADWFRAGYATVRPWPVSDETTLETLIAGRRLLQLNLGLNLRKPGLGVFVDQIANETRAWLDGGS
jgi:Ser/Thr protein kinase RdoA (MazF antagonist)